MEIFILLLIFGILGFAVTDVSRERIVILSILAAGCFASCLLLETTVIPVVIVLVSLGLIAITTSRFTFRAAVTAISMLLFAFLFLGEVICLITVVVASIAILAILIWHRSYDSVINNDKKVLV